MKKRFLIITIILVFTMLLCSCKTSSTNGGNSNNNGNNGQEASNATQFTMDDVVASSTVNFYLPHQVNNVECVDSFTDGQYNYYYFYLGYLENFPLVFSSKIYHKASGGTQTYSETISAEKQKSIETAVSNSITVTDTTKWELGFEVDFSDFLETQRLQLNGSYGEEHATSTATETTHTVAESWLDSSSKTVELTLEKEDPVGYYRYVHYAKKCFVYVVVVYDIERENFVGYDYISYTEKSEKNTVKMFEYSKDENFNSDNTESLKFNESIINTIDLNIPLRDISETIQSVSPIIIPVIKQLCGDYYPMISEEGGYNPNTTGNEKDGHTDHDQHEIGHLVVYGCTKKGNKFNIKEPAHFKIEYIFDENPEKLPNIYNNELYVSNDETAEIKGFRAKGHKVGHGAYQIIITSKSGATVYIDDEYDFMKDKDVGFVQDILKDYTNCNDIGKIEITIVYQLNYFHSPFDQHHTNWRCDYTFYFE